MSRMSPNVTAIDVVLLLPAHVEATARDLNARLSGTLKFDATHLPHLTILQQFVPTRKLGEAEAIVGSIADGLRPLRLSVPGIVTEPFHETEVWYWPVEPSGALTALHDAVSSELTSLACEGAADAFYTDDGEVIRDSTVAYVSNFSRTSAGSNFHPHITLGLGHGESRRDSFAFDADHVAVCHLGNFNTCRKVLYERRF